jgi:hypothetical protein
MESFPLGPGGVCGETSGLGVEHQIARGGGKFEDHLLAQLEEGFQPEGATVGAHRGMFFGAIATLG